MNGSYVQGAGPTRAAAQDASCVGCWTPTVHPGLNPDSLWYSPPNRYYLHWMGSDSARIAETFRVANSSWFDDWQRAGNFRSGAAPRPSSVESVRQSKDTLLWVVGLRTPPQWTPLTQLPARGVAVTSSGVIVGKGAAAALSDWSLRVSSRFESRIDVFDLRTHEFVGGLSFQGQLRQLAPTVFARTVELPNGNLEIEVMHLVAER